MIKLAITGCEIMKNAKKIKIIIVDDSKDFCNILNEFLLNQRDIIVTGIANDGLEALKLIQEKKPDLVILDIIMPHLNGLKVLEKLNTTGAKPMPHILILSAISRKEIIQRAMKLGADNYVIKPFEMNEFIKMIRQMFSSMNDIKKQLTYYENTESKINKNKQIDMITNIVHKIGVPDHIKGCMYLKEAIKMVMNNDKHISTVTEKLYPLIGKKFNTTASRVERAISGVIETAWNSDQVEIISNEKDKLTNSEFITMMADKLRLL